MSNNNKRFSLVCALTKSSRGIGLNGKLPWSLPDDMKYFRKLTTNTYDKSKCNSVIMGRKTWDSLDEKYKPLPKRKNIVVSRSATASNNNSVHFSTSIEDAISHSFNDCNIESTFVIGGGLLYKESINDKRCDKLYITEIDDTDNKIMCDTFFPEIPQRFKLTKVENANNIAFKLYEDWTDVNSTEKDYLKLLQKIVDKGEEREDRTGVGTLSLFGEQLRFSLKDGQIPLITTKRVYWKGVVEELLFFIRGDHDNRKLQNRQVHIWDGNTTREYLDKYNKQHIQVNDLGLAYGVQWRAAGAKLETIDTNYVGKGVDQLSELIHNIKTDPMSRRLIINAWNVPQLKDMALVPCHMMYQFYVSNDNCLSCMMTQRSCDMFLGVPFNIASTALLTHIIADACGLSAGEIIINLGDAHIYLNHIEQVKKQLSRETFRFPKLKIDKRLNTVEDIEKLSFDDIKLIDYHCWPTIKANMAV